MDDLSISSSSGIKAVNNGISSISCSTNSNNTQNTNTNSSLLSSQQPKRQRSCDIIDSRTIILAKTNKQTIPQQSTNSQPSYPTSLTIQQNKQYAANTPVSNNLLNSNSAYVNGSNNTGLISPMSPLSPIGSPANNLLSASNLSTNYNNQLTANKCQMRKSATVQNQQNLSSLQKNQTNFTSFSTHSSSQKSSSHLNSSNSTTTTSANSNSGSQSKDDPSRSNNGELNILLDQVVINDYPTQALVLTVLATLVRNSTDENEIRILYQYIAEASIVFAKVFPVIHNLLDSKINHILQLSLDESILDSVQSIIQNMISSCEMTDSNQQQLSYLQSCGFGGLWRFAQPFSIGREKPENVELFIDCLEAMVETCLPPDNENFSCESSNNLNSNNITSNSSNSNQLNQLTNRSSSSNLNQSSNNFGNISSSNNLITGSMSSISMGSIHSPTDRDLFELNELTRNKNKTIRRNSSPKNLL